MSARQQGYRGTRIHVGLCSSASNGSWHWIQVHRGTRKHGGGENVSPGSGGGVATVEFGSAHKHGNPKTGTQVSGLAGIEVVCFLAGPSSFGDMGPGRRVDRGTGRARTDDQDEMSYAL